MIRGVSLSFSQQNKSFLLTVLKLLCAEKFNWINILSQTEAWGDDFAEAFDKETYFGAKILEEASKIQTILFLKLQAFQNIVDRYSIENFEQFEKSNCQILLLIYDGEFAEIYAKNISLIETLYRELFALGYVDVKLITEEDNFRSSLNLR